MQQPNRTLSLDVVAWLEDGLAEFAGAYLAVFGIRFDLTGAPEFEQSANLAAVVGTIRVEDSSHALKSGSRQDRFISAHGTYPAVRHGRQLCPVTAGA